MNSTYSQNETSQTTKDTINKVKYDVFISYSHQNKNVADAICANFEQNQIKCWYAPRDIIPGKSWPAAIKAAIQESSVFVLVFSEDSNESKQVMSEVSLAYNAEKTIIPFKISETQMSDELEYFLSRYHWLDAVSESLEKKIDELRRYTEQVLKRSTNDIPTPKKPSLQPDIPSTKKETTKTQKSRFEIVKIILLLLIGNLLGPIGTMAVILFLSIGILSGPIRKKLMEKGLSLYHLEHIDDKNNTAARKIFTIAARLGEADAYYYLGKLDEHICNYEGAKKNYQLGIKAGSELADAAHAVLYVNTKYRDYMNSN